jgi:hypothetical protein
MLATERTEQGSPPSHRVVEAIAAHLGVDPVELSVPLYEVVDLEALDDVLSSAGDAGASVTVRFVYAGVEVVVDVDGRVSLSTVE